MSWAPLNEQNQMCCCLINFWWLDVWLLQEDFPFSDGTARWGESIHCPAQSAGRPSSCLVLWISSHQRAWRRDPLDERWGTGQALQSGWWPTPQRQRDSTYITVQIWDHLCCPLQKLDASTIPCLSKALVPTQLFVHSIRNWVCLAKLWCPRWIYMDFGFVPLECT